MHEKHTDVPQQLLRDEEATAARFTAQHQALIEAEEASALLRTQHEETSAKLTALADAGVVGQKETAELQSKIEALLQEQTDSKNSWDHERLMAGEKAREVEGKYESLQQVSICLGRVLSSRAADRLSDI